MDLAVLIALVAITLVAIVVAQVQIRSQYEFQTYLGPDDASPAIASSLGGGLARSDDADDLVLPFSRALPVENSSVTVLPRRSAFGEHHTPAHLLQEGTTFT